jgi:hypothetical protein
VKKLTLTQVLRRVRDAEMPSLEKFTFLILLTYANHRTFGNARPAVRSIATGLGRSISSARAALTALRFNQLIEPVGSDRKGGGAPTTWQLHPECLGRPWREGDPARIREGSPRQNPAGDPANFPKGGPRQKSVADQRTTGVAASSYMPAAVLGVDAKGLRARAAEGSQEETKRAESENAEQVLRWFRDAYQRRVGVPYLLGKRDKEKASQLTALPAARVREAIAAFFSDSADPYYAAHGHPFGLFVTQFDRILAGARAATDDEGGRSSVWNAEKTREYLRSLKPKEVPRERF